MNGGQKISVEMKKVLTDYISIHTSFESSSCFSHRLPFRGRFSSFCWHIWMSCYSLYCHRPWRAVGLLANCCYGLIKQCAGPHLPIFTENNRTGEKVWRAAAGSLPFPPLASPWFFFSPLLPQTKGSAPVGPSPHLLKLFHSPSFWQDAWCTDTIMALCVRGSAFLFMPRWFVCEEIHMCLCMRLRE